MLVSAKSGHPVMSAFIAWLKRVFGGHRPANEMVPFLDANGRVGQIPRSQLRPGMVQVHLGHLGKDGPLVWTRARDFTQGELRHPPFDEQVRAYIRKIQAAFAEHRPLSLEEWEDGFRRDLNPPEEIAIWSYAADVYRAFSANEISLQRRKDVYRVIVACLTSSPDTFWHVLKLEALSRPEAEEIARRIYGKHFLP